MKPIALSFFVVLSFYSITFAQDKGLFEFREFQKAVIDQTRSRTGNPGPGYWLNSSDYKLEVRIDALTNALSGKGTIVYHNNSPAVLKEIHFRHLKGHYPAILLNNRIERQDDGASQRGIDSVL